MTILTNTVEGLTVAVEVTGEPGARPVLLLHGWGAQIESMQGVASGLAARGYYVHTFDLPGFGRSAPPPDQDNPANVWGVADYARFVTRYLDSVNLKPVNLVGHSFGGRLSIVIGADHPEYADKIVLTDSAGVLPTQSGVRSALVSLGKAALKLPGLNAFEARLRKFGRDLLGSKDLKNAGSLEPVFRKVIAEDLLPRAGQIKAPTLLIWGDQDQETPLWMGQLLEKTIPDAGLIVFQGAGHFAYQERLPDFLRIVDTFFGGNA